MENLGKLTFYTALIFVDILVGAFVFMKMWAWFIAPAFGVAELKLIYCVGIALLLSYIKTSSIKPDKKDDLSTKLVVELFLTGACYAGMYLLIGYLVHLFI